MRLNIYEQFIGGVVQPSGGWSKSRPIAHIEEDDKCVPLFNLLIPNDIDDGEIARYVGEKFRAFAQPRIRVTPLTSLTHAPERRERTTQQRGTAGSPVFESVQR
jgi:hypothetical protein